MVDVAESTLTDHVPMIVGPAPNLGVEFLDQIGGRLAERGLRFQDSLSERFVTSRYLPAMVRRVLVMEDEVRSKEYFFR